MEMQTYVDCLKKQGVLLYPTDTVWGLGCDVASTQAVEKIITLKGKKMLTGFIVLVSDINMLGRYIKDIPDVIFDLEENSDRPLTYVLDNPVGVAPLLVHDNSLAIRIPKNTFCKQLIKKFGKAIVSTSANFTGNAAPATFAQVEKKIIESVDAVVDAKYEIGATGVASTVIKINSKGEFTFIRK